MTKRLSVLSITEEKSFIRFLSVSPLPFAVSELTPRPSMKAKTTAERTSKNGGIETEKKGFSDDPFSTPDNKESFEPRIIG